MIILVVLPFLFFASNESFFTTAEKESKEGAKWHYVGKQSLDLKAKSLPLQVKGEKPFILWKLKK